MADLVTLICPPGAFDYPISHGARDFYPYRADHLASSGPEFGGPWLVDVPPDAAQYFIHNGGFYMAEDKSPAAPAGMARVRKKDGSDSSCGFRGIAYPADDDGVALVPADAVAELCESHGFEIVPDEPPKKVDKDEPATVRRVPRG